MLIDDFKKILLKKVDEIKIDFGINLDENLNQDDESYIEKILSRYFNFKNKTLSDDVKYNIECSNEIKESLKNLDDEFKGYLKEILERILKGENIIPYQSKTVVSADDNLFYQYGINHLHLSPFNEDSENDFTRRSDYILLYVVENLTVYLIDIVKHPRGYEWIKSDYWEIYNKNWPQNDENLKLNGPIDVFPKFTPEEQYRLEKSGVFLFKTSGNSVFMPKYPKATNNIPIDYNLKIKKTISEIYNFQKLINDANWIKKQNFETSDILNFKLVEFENVMYLCEKQNESCCTLKNQIFR